MSRRRKHQHIPSMTYSDLEPDSDIYASDAPPPHTRTDAELNLSVLRRYNQQITSIEHISSYAVVYIFSPSSSTWEKANIEGSAFILALQPTPSHAARFSVMVLNRLGLENFDVELTSADMVDVQEEYINIQGERGGVECVFGLWIFEEKEPASTANQRAEMARKLVECARRVDAGRRDVGAEDTGYEGEKEGDGSVELDAEGSGWRVEGDRADLAGMLSQQRKADDSWSVRSHSPVRQAQSHSQPQASYTSQGQYQGAPSFTASADTDFFLSTKPKVPKVTTPSPAISAQSVQDSVPNTLLELFRKAGNEHTQDGSLKLFESSRVCPSPHIRIDFVVSHEEVLYTRKTTYSHFKSNGFRPDDYWLVRSANGTRNGEALRKGSLRFFCSDTAHSPVNHQHGIYRSVVLFIAWARQLQDGIAPDPRAKIHHLCGQAQCMNLDAGHCHLGRKTPKVDRLECIQRFSASLPHICPHWPVCSPRDIDHLDNLPRHNISKTWHITSEGAILSGSLISEQLCAVPAKLKHTNGPCLRRLVCTTTFRRYARTYLDHVVTQEYHNGLGDNDCWLYRNMITEQSIDRERADKYYTRLTLKWPCQHQHASTYHLHTNSALHWIASMNAVTKENVPSLDHFGSHLCGTRTCTNPIHIRLEEHSVAGKRWECAQSTIFCSHWPTCIHVTNRPKMRLVDDDKLIKLQRGILVDELDEEDN